jgi:hypothetical protein
MILELNTFLSSTHPHVCASLLDTTDRERYHFIVNNRWFYKESIEITDAIQNKISEFLRRNYPNKKLVISSAGNSFWFNV